MSIIDTCDNYIIMQHRIIFIAIDFNKNFETSLYFD